MPYTMRYGSPYEVPAAGAGLAQGAKTQTDFSRIMQNNKIKLQDRELDLQEAQLSLQRSRLELQEEKEARMQRTAKREAELRREKMKLRRKEFQRDRELKRMREQRLQEQLDFRMEKAGIKNKQAVREEINQLRAQGAVPADSGMEPPQNSYTYQDTTGQKWHVPRIDPAKQRKRNDMVRQERNKLRKWGGKRVESKDNVGENRFAWEDAAGNVWAVPKQAEEGFNEDMREQQINFLDDQAKNLRSRRDQAVNERTTLQQENARLKKQFRQATGIAKNPTEVNLEKADLSDSERQYAKTIQAQLETNNKRLENVSVSRIDQGIGETLLRKGLMQGAGPEQLKGIKKRWGVSDKAFNRILGADKQQGERGADQEAAAGAAQPGYSGSTLAEGPTGQTQRGDESGTEDITQPQNAAQYVVYHGIQPGENLPEQAQSLTPTQILLDLAKNNPEKNLAQITQLGHEKGWLNVASLEQPKQQERSLEGLHQMGSYF